MQTLAVLGCWVGVLAVGLASPAGLIATPIVLARLNSPQVAAPIGPDGRVVDTVDVAIAKVRHVAAQQNQRVSLGNQEILAAVVDTESDERSGAPIGLDGRVIDTPQVALAKVQHANAQLAEKVSHANAAVAARNDPSLIAVATRPTTPLITVDRILY